MDIPADVLSAVKTTPTWDLFPVTGTEVFSGQVLKAHKLQFDSGATLVLMRLDLPFLAICTNQILLRAPAVKSTIMRDPNLVAPDGIAGSPGNPGSCPPQPGGHGSNGSAGTKGGPGGTVAIPTLYLFVEEVLIHPGSQLTWFDLAIDFAGVRGGVGGAGGDGGSGGRGANGPPGLDVGFTCAKPPGNGGNGGNGANGGAGGAGGNGSDGGTLIYVGPQSALDQLAWVKVTNHGEPGGLGGKGGQGGVGGKGGFRGENTVFCYGGYPGYPGVKGADGADGLPGADGGKGTVNLVAKPSIAELFS